MSTEMITFVIGMLSALSILAERLIRLPKPLFEKLSDRMKRILAALVVVGIVATFATQTIQYVYAATSNKDRNRIEREYARTLYLFSENKLDLTAQFLKNNKYVVGYQAYRNKDYVTAKGYFRETIEAGQFVPESHYLLAYIDLLEHEKAGNGDLSVAMNEVIAAHNADRDYIAPYYLRGILEVKGNLIENGLNDLKVAVLSDGTACYDLQQHDEIKRWWQRVAEDPIFQGIQAQCRAKWGLSPGTH